MIPSIEVISNNKQSKPWLMLVHGVSQDSRFFSKQIDVFKEMFNLLLVDLPGHGKSSDMDGPYGLNEFALSLKAAQDEININSSHFCGTHLGAGAGLLLAANNPNRIKSLILESPVLAGVPLPSVTKTLQKVRTIALEQSIEAAREVWFNESEWFSILHKNPIECREEEQWEIISSFTGKPWLDKSLASPVTSIEDSLLELNIPTMIINGEYDLNDFKEVSNKVNKLIRNSSRVQILNAGGFPLWEYPDIVNKEIIDFYEKNIFK